MKPKQIIKNLRGVKTYKQKFQLANLYFKDNYIQNLTVKRNSFYFEIKSANMQVTIKRWK